MTFMHQFTARTAIFLASSVLLQGLVGLHSISQAAQPFREDYHHRDRIRGEGTYWNNILGWNYKKQQKQVGTGSLAAGQKVERWPDGTRTIADTGGILAATGTGIQPVSEKACPNVTQTCPSPSVSQTCPAPVVTPVATAVTPCPPCPSKKAKAEDVSRASDLSPGHILVDEYGRRIEMANNGTVEASSKTAVSLVPDWAPGSTLTDEKQANADIFQRVFPEDKKVAGKPTIIPATATASILPGGTAIAAVPGEQLVAAGTCPVGLTDKDKERISTYFNDQLKRANLLSSQYIALSPAQQQQVLMGEQLTIPVSELTASCIVPNEVQAQLVRGGTLSQETINQYGIALPDKLNSKLSDLPTGYQRVMIGGNVVVLGPNNQIMDTYNVAS